MSEHDAEQALSNLAGEIAKLVCERPPTATALQPAMANPESGARPELPVRQSKLYGREPMLDQLAAALKRDEVLALYGFRGNGKSALIRQLQKRADGVPKDWPHLDAASEQDAQSLYRRLADRLGDRSDRPMPPTGSVEQMASTLRERFPDVGQEVVWIDRAHLWFRRESWANEGLGALFRAMRRAFSGQWRWIFELRERPAQALQGAGVSLFEVRGLDKASLGEWLLAEAPQGHEAQWRYAGDELKRVYQWLGGGQGEHAHPLATQLLIEVARGRKISPVAALRGVLDSVEDRIDAALLADLYDKVLAPNEQRVLQALALYRSAIPHDHVDKLEQRLQAAGGWDGLDRRCLLASEADQERFFLHGFVAGWLRHRLGYPDASEDAGIGDVPTDFAPAKLQSLEKLHSVIADCWLESLGQARRVTQPNITRALEAFHHSLAAGRADQLGKIAVNLFGGSEVQVLTRLWSYDEGLRAKRAPLDQQISVLNLITRIDVGDHKAWRFLGECLDRTNAPKERVMACYEQALAGNPDFPQYLANIGSLMLKSGSTGAEAFLQQLAKHRVTHPLAINEVVEAIEADCLLRVGRGNEASLLRRERIEARSNHPTFYTAEAEYQLAQGDPGEAMRLLDLSQQHGATDNYTDSIRSSVLEALGRDDEASRVRREHIEARSNNPAFYTAEAVYQMAQGNLGEAMRLLDLSRQHGAMDSYTDSIRSTVLETLGRGGEASCLRRERIEARSNNPAFYAAEAEYQLAQGDPGEAMRLLDLAKQHGATDNYTDSIRSKLVGRE
jgi:Flp pilus assembly protein TadD